MIARLKKVPGPPNAVIAKGRNSRKTPDAIVACEKRPGLLTLTTHTPLIKGGGGSPP